MKVLAADFVTSAVDRSGIPHDGLPQIALVGRSNVGKSTLINALAGRKIAHTSAKPGKTRLANLYRVHVSGRLRAAPDLNALRRASPKPGDTAAAEAGGRAERLGATETWRLYLVDLPGYGYTRGKNAREEFARITGEYFGAVGETGTATVSSEPRRRETVAVPVSVVQVVDARHPGLEADIAARDWIDTLGVARVIAATKIDKLSRNERARTLREIEREMNGPVAAVSATTGEGLEELWIHLIRMASRPQQPPPQRSTSRT